MYFLVYCFTDFKIEGKENVREIKNGPLIVIANHKGHLDAPLLGLCFPYFSRIYPLRFITKDCFLKPFFSRTLFKSLGCFPAFYGEGIEKSLEIPSRLLQKGATVIFFPEGKQYKGDGLSEPQIGIGVLMLRFPEIHVLPVAIAGTQIVGRFGLLYKYPKIRMKIGLPLRLKDKIEVNTDYNAKEISKMLMKEVEMLYNDIQ